MRGNMVLGIKTILWDVDSTLLDFGAAERAAIRKLTPATIIIDD